MSNMRDKFNTEQKSSIFLLAIKVPVSSGKECTVYTVWTTEALETIPGELPSFNVPQLQKKF